MTKAYVAARARYRAKEVAEIQDTLVDMGYETAYDWPSNNDDIRKPYRNPKNRAHNLNAQEKMLKAAAETDIFIFLDDPGLRGAYVELGAFLHSCMDKPHKNRRAYIVGPESHIRQHVFESPEYVIFQDSIEEVYEDLKK